MEVSGSNENYYVAVLGLAETFRTANPPNLRLCIQCLQSLFNFQLPPHLQTLAHFYFGKVLHQYTRNEDLARAHLEQAFAKSNIPGFEQIRVQIAAMLAEVYLKQRHIDCCKQTIHQVLEMSCAFSFWRCKLLFQLAEAAIYERDFETAYRYLDIGAEYCASTNVLSTESLFRLSKGMILLIDKDRANNTIAEVHTILQRVTCSLNSMSGSVCRREGLKAFFLVLQLCHLLMTGGVYDSVLAVGTLMPLEYFQWLPKEDLCIFVYLVTVIHAMQAGQMEKAGKYTEKALSQIEKVRACGRGNPNLLDTFEVLLLEHSAMCRMVVGQPSLAIQEKTHSVFAAHESQLHTLLGLYAMIMRCPDAAERQFNTALRVAKDIDLWSFVNLNLAVMYLQSNRDQDFYAILERITPERLRTKRYLKDSLAMSNNEDLSRISTAALVLLGHIFLKYHNIQECSNMLSPALELANRIPDLSFQIWATSLLKEVYSVCGDSKKAEDVRQVYETYILKLEKDVIKARESRDHSLINWVEGPCLFLPGSVTL